MSDINEHDITKGMLSTIRRNQIIKEEENDSIQLSGEEKTEEESKLKQAVGPRITFDENSVVIYPYDNNVIMRGQFDDGIMFDMQKVGGLFITTASKKTSVQNFDGETEISDETGGEIEMTPLQLNNNDVVEMLQKLKGYYDVWLNEWSDKIQDYKKDLK